MKKLLFGVFAHPDDETFGPCGTFLTETANGTELYLISLTLGEAGNNPDNSPDLSALREKEWRAAGKAMGASALYTLGYQDGKLSNDSLQAINRQLTALIGDIIHNHPEPVQAEVLTFELNGISGHIDHIVAARAASYAFYTLKQQQLPMMRIRYYCKTLEQAPAIATAWLFSNPGYPPELISETIDARDYHDQIIDIMRLHRSQREDFAWHIKNRSAQIGLDYYVVQS